MKLWTKRLIKLIQCLPIIIKAVSELWDNLEEVYNKETMQEIELLAKEKGV